jgi:hypothetical protein
LQSVLGKDPSHQIVSTARQIWGSQDEIIPASMSGFVAASNSTLAMKCYNSSTIPVISSLALNFTLFDAFHSSVPGPTGPNRMYFHSATSHGAATNIAELEIRGYPQRSFLVDLEFSKKSWGVYFEGAVQKKKICFSLNFFLANRFSSGVGVDGTFFAAVLAFLRRKTFFFGRMFVLFWTTFISWTIFSSTREEARFLSILFLNRDGKMRRFGQRQHNIQV